MGDHPYALALMPGQDLVHGSIDPLLHLSYVLATR